jgi:hypothetical protein
LWSADQISAGDSRISAVLEAPEDVDFSLWYFARSIRLPAEKLRSKSIDRIGSDRPDLLVQEK